MSELQYTLLSDGSSDRALLPLINWLLIESGVKIAIQEKWADLRGLPNPPKDLEGKIEKCLDLYPCELLFVHRDAEGSAYQVRVGEIKKALNKVENVPQAVCVVPVRMQEAWLLFNERAIRMAAGNPNGKRALMLPPLKQMERIPDPKSILHESLRDASGLRGRRLRQFNTRMSAYRVAEFIDDFAPLRNLNAFQMLETDVQHLVADQGWNKGLEKSDDLSQ